MLDFNTVGIKGTDDLQEALQIEHSARAFEIQVMGMIDRWGIEDTLRMLGVALCGNGEDLKPIILFKERLVINNPQDPWDDGRRVPIKNSS
jgi:hypothetical protein